MAIHRTAKIPMSRVIHVGIWSNIESKGSLASAYKKIAAKYPGKEIYVMNGGFFDTSRGKNYLRPCWGMKAGGKMYGSEWTGMGFMAFNGKQIRFCSQGSNFPAGMSDGLSGYPVLIENGHKSPYYHDWCDGKRDRGRTMIGFNRDYIVMSCISDCSGTSDFTMKEELDYMLGMGCEFAMNCDGGGSSQCNFNGATIKSSRVVSNFVYLVAEPAPDLNKEYRRQAQIWLNNTYNAGLAVDGILGKNSNKATIKGMQKEIGVTADGIWGNNSNRAFTTLKPGMTGNRVKLLQCALMRKGYWNNGVDGNYDNDLKNQVIMYQRSVKLSADGLAGKNTIRSLFK